MRVSKPDFDQVAEAIRLEVAAILRATPQAKVEDVVDRAIRVVRDRLHEASGQEGK